MNKKVKTSVRLFECARRVLRLPTREPKPAKSAPDEQFAHSMSELLRLLNRFFVERSPANVIEQMNDLLDEFLADSETLNRYTALHIQNMVHQHNALMLFIVQLKDKYLNVLKGNG